MNQKRLRERTIEKLARLESENLTRRLSSPCGSDLSSNDFLCLAKDERLVKAMIEGIEREGIGSTGSRLLRGERDCFRKVEKRFAAFKNTENALYFGSGYQANVGLLTAFLEPGDTVFSDEFNHASIIDGIRLSKANRVIFKHRDVSEIAAQKRGENQSGGQKFLVTESLFSMDGTIAPLAEYAEICAETGANLIVDEAHAVGVFGMRGSGLIEQFGIENQVFLSLNTAGKALGAAGAFVAGDDWAIRYLINKSRPLIFSTAPPPAVADALVAAIEIVETESKRRKRLLDLSNFLRALLKENGFQVSIENSQIVPVVIGESGKAVRVAEELQSAGFDVRAVRPPTVPPDTARLRVSLNVGLTEDILREFVGSLVRIVRSF